MAQFSGEQFEVYNPSLEPRYDLDDGELHALSSQLLSEREPVTSDKVVCYRLEKGSAYENVARSIEREVFEKYFGNTSEEMRKEYGPYEDQSIFFLSIDQELKQPAGVLRVIQNGPAGLKTLNDLAIGRDEAPRISPDQVKSYHGIDTFDDCWDVGTVAVRKPYRSDTLASVQLYRALYVSALDENVNHFVSIIDHKPYVKMTDYLGIPFVPMVGSEPFPYLGSKSSVAVYGDVTEFYPRMNRKRYTLRGALARSALRPLVKGTNDHTLQL